MSIMTLPQHPFSMKEGDCIEPAGKVGMIHKVIGYGLDHIECCNGCCVDRRFSNESFLNNPSHYSMDGFADFMFRGNQRYIELEELNVSLKDCIHYVSGTSGKILCITIPHMVDHFSRRNNPIDQIESECEVLPRIRFFSRGLPGFKTIADIRTGRPISSSLHMLFAIEYNKYLSPQLCDAERYGLEFTLAEMATELGFKTVTEAAANIGPAIPFVIDQLCIYLNIFNVRGAISTMRPMSLTYKE